MTSRGSISPDDHQALHVCGVLQPVLLTLRPSPLASSNVRGVLALKRGEPFKAPDRTNKVFNVDSSGTILQFLGLHHPGHFILP
jgi:hypothetical protein